MAFAISSEDTTLGSLRSKVTKAKLSPFTLLELDQKVPNIFLRKIKCKNREKKHSKCYLMKRLSKKEISLEN